VENQKQVFHFPTAFFSLSKRKERRGRASPPARRLQAKSGIVGPENAKDKEKLSATERGQ
jgi:hypothetical protein